MNEKILAVCIPKYTRDVESGNGNIQIDFLLNKEEDNIRLTNTEEEYNTFINNLDKEKVSEKETYHLEHIVDYLKQYHGTSTKTLNLDRFSPHECFTLYTLLAKNGMITLINSEYCSLLFLPKDISMKQKKSLKLLNEIIDENTNFSCLTVENLNDPKIEEEISYSQILENLNIEVESIKKGI